jgi:hypothetical protein
LQRQLEQRKSRVQRGQFQPGRGGRERPGGIAEGVLAALSRRQRRAAGAAGNGVAAGVVDQGGGTEDDVRRRAVLERGGQILDFAQRVGAEIERRGDEGQLAGGGCAGRGQQEGRERGA